MNLEKFNITDCNYLLKCVHAIGTSRYNYTMPCVLLGKTKTGKMKVLVFGDRYWKSGINKKKIRYVSFQKLVKHNYLSELVSHTKKLIADLEESGYCDHSIDYCVCPLVKEIERNVSIIENGTGKPWKEIKELIG